MQETEDLTCIKLIDCRFIMYERNLIDITGGLYDCWKGDLKRCMWEKYEFSIERSEVFQY